mmetsp:Transcript_28078/g.58792  ORF Transcript_28078/g.58792 Transcript_28078/m.58792 type:complete len:259 (+) Transcript_28078:278-1054(+)
MVEVIGLEEFSGTASKNVVGHIILLCAKMILSASFVHGLFLLISSLCQGSGLVPRILILVISILVIAAVVITIVYGASIFTTFLFVFLILPTSSSTASTATSSTAPSGVGNASTFEFIRSSKIRGRRFLFGVLASHDHAIVGSIGIAIFFPKGTVRFHFTIDLVISLDSRVVIVQTTIGTSGHSVRIIPLIIIIIIVLIMSIFQGFRQERSFLFLLLFDSPQGGFGNFLGFLLFRLNFFLGFKTSSWQGTIRNQQLGW